MITIILPGFSIHNREWAYEIKKQIKLKHKVEVVEWEHWPPAQFPTQRVSKLGERASGSARNKGESFRLKTEMDKIFEIINKEKVNPHNQSIGVGVNIIAKSVGTRVTMELLKIVKDKTYPHSQKFGVGVNKIILCGIPSVSEKMQQVYKEALADFDPENIICIQNSKDPLATFAEVRAFINSINAKIKVIEKPASNHDYPYPTDFQEFLTS